MKMIQYFILSVFLLHFSCISLNVSDINPDVKVHSTVNPDVHFDGSFFSDTSVSYKEMKKSSTENSLQMQFKGFEGENYIILAMDNPTVLELNNKVLLYKGNLSFSLENMDEKVLWEQSFSGSQSEFREVQQIKIDKSGKYKLKIRGNGTRGNYTLSWY